MNVPCYNGVTEIKISYIVGSYFFLGLVTTATLMGTICFDVGTVTGDPDPEEGSCGSE